MSQFTPDKALNEKAVVLKENIHSKISVTRDEIIHKLSRLHNEIDHLWSALATEADTKDLEESRGKRGLYTQMAMIESQINNVLQAKMVIEVLLSSPDKTTIQRLSSIPKSMDEAEN